MHRHFTIKNAGHSKSNYVRVFRLTDLNFQIMKRISYFFIPFFIFIVSFYGCKKNSEIQEKVIKNTTTFDYARCNESNLTDSQIALIAQKHNEVLEVVFQNFDYNNPNHFYELQHQFNINYPEKEIDWVKVQATNDFYYDSLKKNIILFCF